MCQFSANAGNWACVLIFMFHRSFKGLPRRPPQPSEPLLQRGRGGKESLLYETEASRLCGHLPMCKHPYVLVGHPVPNVSPSLIL